MNNYSSNGTSELLTEFETPFADTSIREFEKSNDSESGYADKFLPELESPFSRTYEQYPTTQNQSPLAAEMVELLSELNNSEFPTTLYNLASELEESWSTKVTNEVSMGDRFIPLVTQHANEYFAPLINETESMIDTVSQKFSGNNFADNNEAEIDKYLSELNFVHYQNLSPAQEQFFGDILKKVKSVVKVGVSLAKKGISAVGKLMPIGIVLKKLKQLIRPLLNKVLKFAIGKLPKNLQQHARTLANKLLGLGNATHSTSHTNSPSSTPSPTSTATNAASTPNATSEPTATPSATSTPAAPSAGNVEAVQTEFDTQITNLLFSGEEYQADEAVLNYETSNDTQQRELNFETSGLNLPSINEAKQQFVNDLKNLKDGESAAPAIEKFLPAILALQPIIKIGIMLIGRQKVINFLAGMLAKLVAKYVPENVAKPLAAGIIDVGMAAIGFETLESSRSDLAYEAIANTIQETIQNMSINEATINNQERLMSETLQEFERAAANNFPQNHIRPDLRPSTQQGLWVNMPRIGPRHMYKKFTHVFPVTITPHIAKSLTTFRGLTIESFLKDKLGLDPSHPIQARVHLYEGMPGTRLSQISQFERVPGLGSEVPHGYKQFHPLSVQSAGLLLREPGLGRNFPDRYTTHRYKTAVGQRFFYLEIPNAPLRVVPVVNTTNNHNANQTENLTTVVPNSGDIQFVVDLLRAKLKLNYFISEADAKRIAEHLNAASWMGAAQSFKTTFMDALRGILLKNIGSKVKIIQETMPELYLENSEDNQEQFAPLAIAGVAAEYAVTKIIEKLVEKIGDLAFESIVNYFKYHKDKFIEKQAMQADGVTIKLIYSEVRGMEPISAWINYKKGTLSIGNIVGLGSMLLPVVPSLPEIIIVEGKSFD